MSERGTGWVWVCVSVTVHPPLHMCMFAKAHFVSPQTGKGGKNRRRGKNENDSDKRELVFKEDGQGELS